MARLGLERSVVDAEVLKLELVPAWDAMINDVNAQSGAAAALNA